MKICKEPMAFKRKGPGFPADVSEVGLAEGRCDM